MLSVFILATDWLDVAGACVTSGCRHVTFRCPFVVLFSSIGIIGDGGLRFLFLRR